ncbi:MAG: aminotransferase class I/II-fold pyridoxal phosphate-dependent enzyme [Proteobacteria bacterium]|nr:aminotransferase class I/II-fold pyridoxal phosphate-dependent enzyme [Pseudomonadota bacterium]
MAQQVPIRVVEELYLSGNFGDEGERQLRWDFEGTFENLKERIDRGLKETGLSQMLAQLSRTSRRNDLSARKSIEADGHRIFRVLTKNDDISVEADYGAPAIGLNFYPELFHPTRSYRYERVRTIEGGYKTHVDQARAVGRHLKAKGYQIFNGVAADDTPSHIFFANGGVTSAFSSLIRYLVDEHKEISEARKAHNRYQKGVFLMPVPTYGLFLYSMETLLEGTDIEIRYVRRHDSGAVDQSSLKRVIDECALENKRILGYYDCNPHNPRGHIRQEQETREVAAILQAVTDSYKESDTAFLDKMEGKDVDFKLMGHPDKPQNGIVIIDDMAYEGLEHKPEKVPFSFGQVSKQVAYQTAVLKGVSKIGMPGARIGLMVSDSQFVSVFAERQLIHEFTASSLGVDIIAARYSAGKHQRLFASHGRALRRLHRQKSGMMEAFTDGIENTERLNKTQKKKLIADYAAHAGIDKKEAEARLKEGLPHFHISRDIDCGFFMVMNVEALRGKLISVSYDDKPRPSMSYINNGNTMYWVFKSFGVDVVPLINAGSDYRCLEARLTLSLKDQDLFTLFDRLRDMHAHFFKNEPQVQLDLFRHKPFKGLNC